MSWLEQHHRDVYDAIVEADRRGGRAIAQGYGHAILPLCDDRDLRTQIRWGVADFRHRFGRQPEGMWRSEEHTSELQSLMRISYAVFCLKKKKNKKYNRTT